MGDDVPAETSRPGFRSAEDSVAWGAAPLGEGASAWLASGFCVMRDRVLDTKRKCGGSAETAVEKAAPPVLEVAHAVAGVRKEAPPPPGQFFVVPGFVVPSRRRRAGKSSAATVAWRVA